MTGQHIAALALGAVGLLITLVGAVRTYKAPPPDSFKEVQIAGHGGYHQVVYTKPRKIFDLVLTLIGAVVTFSGVLVGLTG